MAEQTRTKYDPLFEVQLLHHYFLDEGQTDFSALDAQKQAKYLLNYDCRQVFHIAPTPATARQLQGFGGLFRATATGFLVACPNAVDLPDSAVFEFTVRVCDANFYQYTALSYRRSGIVEIQHDGRLYRFKENVFVFDNQFGAATGATGYFYLSQPAPALQSDIAYPVEALALDGTDVVQFTGDFPGDNTTPPTQTLNDTTPLPRFVNTADQPILQAPAGLSGLPVRGIELIPDLPDDLYSLIRIRVKCPGNPTLNLTDDNGVLQKPIFELHFKNRSTWRRYFPKTGGALTSEETSPLPLTRFGNAGSKLKPSAGIVKADRDTNDPERITKLISEIFE